jgi:hypothetical protein
MSWKKERSCPAASKTYYGTRDKDVRNISGMGKYVVSLIFTEYRHL